MSDESQGVDPYASVLADLKAKRDQIDQAIQAIESVRGGATPKSSAEAFRAEAAQGGAIDDGPGAYLGLTIAEAAKKMLRTRRKALTNAELVAGFRAGGLVLNSVDEMNTVNAVLARRFQNNGDIVRVARGTWGLKEWYPNRSFKKDAKGEAMSAEDQQAIADAMGSAGGLRAAVEASMKDDPNAPAQPSKPKTSSVFD